MPSTWFQGQVCCCVRETYHHLSHAYLAGLRWSLRLMTELMLFPLRSFPQTTPRAEGNPSPICTERTEGTIECGKHHAQQPLSISPTLGNTLGATQTYVEARLCRPRLALNKKKERWPACNPIM